MHVHACMWWVCICFDDGSFAIKEIKLFLDQTVGVKPDETLHLLDLWKLPGRSWTLSSTCVYLYFPRPLIRGLCLHPQRAKTLSTDKKPVWAQCLSDNLIHSTFGNATLKKKKVIYFLIIPCLAFLCIARVSLFKIFISLRCVICSKAMKGRWNKSTHSQRRHITLTCLGLFWRLPVNTFIFH